MQSYGSPPKTSKDRKPVILIKSSSKGRNNKLSNKTSQTAAYFWPGGGGKSASNLISIGKANSKSSQVHEKVGQTSQLGGSESEVVLNLYGLSQAGNDRFAPTSRN